MAKRLALSEVRALVHQTFTLTAGTETLDLVLAEVRDLGVRATAQGQQDNYSLLFRSPVRDRYAPQAVYRLDHAGVGPLEVFLVPLGPDAEGMRYEAIFN